MSVVQKLIESGSKVDGVNKVCFYICMKKHTSVYNYVDYIHNTMYVSLTKDPFTVYIHVTTYI